MKIIAQLQMAFTCISEPCYDLLNTVFFCCGKRYKRICQISRYIKEEHDEVFSFGSAEGFKRNEKKIYSRVCTNYFKPDNLI